MSVDNKYYIDKPSVKGAKMMGTLLQRNRKAFLIRWPVNQDLKQAKPTQLLTSFLLGLSEALQVGSEKV